MTEHIVDPADDITIQVIYNDLPINCSGKISDFYYKKKYKPVNINNSTYDLIKINIKILDSSISYEICIDSNSTGNDLIQLIYERYLITENISNLIFNDRDIDLDSMLYAENIEDGDTIYAIFQSNYYPISFFIREINEYYNDIGYTHINLDINEDSSFNLENIIDFTNNENDINNINTTLSNEEINNNYPEKKYNMLESAEKTNNMQCNICYTDFKNEDIIRMINCKHIYHKECIDKWFTNYSNECPKCKKES